MSGTRSNLPPVVGGGGLPDRDIGSRSPIEPFPEETSEAGNATTTTISPQISEISHLVTAYTRTSFSEIERILSVVYQRHRQPITAIEEVRAGLHRQLNAPNGRSAPTQGSWPTENDNSSSIINAINHWSQTSPGDITIRYTLTLEGSASTDIPDPSTPQRRAFLQGRADRGRSFQQLFYAIENGASATSSSTYTAVQPESESHTHFEGNTAPETYEVCLQGMLDILSALSIHRHGAEESLFRGPGHFLLRIRQRFLEDVGQLRVVMRLDRRRILHIFMNPWPPGRTRQPPSETRPAIDGLSRSRAITSQLANLQERSLDLAGRISQHELGDTEIEILNLGALRRIYHHQVALTRELHQQASVVSSRLSVSPLGTEETFDEIENIYSSQEQYMEALRRRYDEMRSRVTANVLRGRRSDNDPSIPELDRLLESEDPGSANAYYEDPMTGARSFR